MLRKIWRRIENKIVDFEIFIIEKVNPKLPFNFPSPLLYSFWTDCVFAPHPQHRYDYKKKKYVNQRPTLKMILCRIVWHGEKNIGYHMDEDGGYNYCMRCDDEW